MRSLRAARERRRRAGRLGNGTNSILSLSWTQRTLKLVAGEPWTTAAHGAVHEYLMGDSGPAENTSESPPEFIEFRTIQHSHF
jgi:hypothetical protein